MFHQPKKYSSLSKRDTKQQRKHYFFPHIEIGVPLSSLVKKERRGWSRVDCPDIYMQRVPSVFHVLDDEVPPLNVLANHPQSGHVAMHPVTYHEEHRHRLTFPPFILIFSFFSSLFAWRPIVARFGLVYSS